MSNPDRAGRWTVGVLTVLAVGLMGVIVYPFAAPLFVGAVLAGALYPRYEALSRRLRGHRELAAGVMTVAVLLLVLVPIASLVAVVANQAVSGATYVRDTLRSQGTVGLVQDLPPALRAPANRLLEQLPSNEEELRRSFGGRAGGAAAIVGGFLSATWDVVVSSAMMLIALFFFLVDGAALVGWLTRVAPLGPAATHGLLVDFRKVSVTVIVSSIATAAVQAGVALLGYWIARLPHAIFFAAVTFVVGLVPAVGGGGVALAAAGIALLSGHTYAALFLAIWAVTAVGLSDNFVKPLLIKGGMQIHGAVVFFALLGGLAVFGPVGLLVGPLVVSFFLSVSRMWERREDVEVVP